MYITEYTCRVITPMLIHGADGAGSTAELRAPSIKGAMRFWWRAVNANLDSAVQKEKYIFGGVNNNAQKSRFFVSVELHSGQKPKKCELSAGKKKFSVSGYDVNAEFKVRFVVRPGIENGEEVLEEVNRTFEILSLCGGLGMKTRRGYGAFTIVQKNGEDYVLPVDSYIEYINNAIKSDENQVNTSIISVEMGKSFENANDFFGKVNTSISASRQLKEYKKKEISFYNINCALGTIIGGRKASTVIVSPIILKKPGDSNDFYYAIITRLYFKSSESSKDEDMKKIEIVQSKFIEKMNVGG